MNKQRSIAQLNKLELENAVPSSASWHTDYRDTSYVFIAGLPHNVSEGDVLTIFSQFGEPTWLKLARDKDTGKFKGYGWLKYEDQRSCDLAVDNLGGAEVLGRKLGVDHARYTKRDDDDGGEFDVPGKEEMERIWGDEQKQYSRNERDQTPVLIDGGKERRTIEDRRGERSRSRSR